MSRNSRGSVTERGEESITGIHVGKADLNVLEHGGQDNKGVPGPRGPREEGEGSEADSLAKHLLQGQRVTGVVHQGQVPRLIGVFILVYKSQNLA